MTIGSFIFAIFNLFFLIKDASIVQPEFSDWKFKLLDF